MVCNICNDRHLCDTCFLQWFISRVRKALQEEGLIKKHECIGIPEHNGAAANVLQHALKTIVGNLPCTITVTAHPQHRTAWPTTANSLCVDWFTCVLREKPFSLPQGLHILRVVTDDDVNRYARLMNLDGVQRAFQSKINHELIKLQHKHPSILYGFAKSVWKTRRLST